MHTAPRVHVYRVGLFTLVYYELNGKAFAAEQSVLTKQRAESATLHAVVYAACMELVGMCCASRQHTEIALDYIGRAKEALVAITVVPPVGDSPSKKAEQPTPLWDGTVIDEREHANAEVGNSVAAPPRVRSRGRPKQSRIKSPIEVTKSGAKKKRAASKTPVGTRNVKPRKDKKSAAAAKDKTDPKCRLCGSNAHYAARCAQNDVQGPRGHAITHE